jgi:Ca2+-binding RTX toxin-like protein
MFGDVGDPNALFSKFTDSLAASDINALAGLVVSNVSSKPAALHYGDDVLTGGNGNAANMLVGDAYELSSRGLGGNDVLTGGGAGTINMLVGDAMTMEGRARGGKDILVSGEGQDTMYGDSVNGGGRGGADKFVFAPGNGQDVIEDFHVRERDRIDLSTFEGDDFRSFSTLVASGRMQDTDGGVMIDLEEVSRRDVDIEGTLQNTVLLAGVTVADLSSSVFIF